MTSCLNADDAASFKRLDTEGYRLNLVYDGQYDPYDSYQQKRCHVSPQEAISRDLIKQYLQTWLTIGLTMRSLIVGDYCIDWVTLEMMFFHFPI